MLQLILSVAGFSMSVGGLASAFALKDQRKSLVLSLTLAALLATTGTALFEHVSARHQISIVRTELAELLEREELTFDELYQQLPFRSYQQLNQALSLGVDEGVIGHRLVHLQIEGRLLSVRMYFIK